MLRAYLEQGEAVFQSAPLTDVRGDQDPFQKAPKISKFQSAPLTDVRGDKYSFKVPARFEKFQSAPLTDVRGDPLIKKIIPDREGRFNPLPSLM